MLTASGIKPECQFQQVFKSTYLYGAFSACKMRGNKKAANFSFAALLLLVARTGIEPVFRP
jgi:hypothetical protein